MIHSRIFAAAAAFILVMAFVPLLIRLCFQWQILDPPGPLKIHRHPVPRLGGIAVVVSIATPLLLASPGSFARQSHFLLALGVICVAGVIDDIWHLPVAVRLLVQIAAASILFAGGWQIFPNRSVPGFIATVFWILLFVNSLNFFDGADGLASATACLVALGFTVTFGSRSPAFALHTAYAVAGSCAAFLTFNLAGKIHLGDGGSTSLGLLIAALGLNNSGESSQVFCVPLFICVASALPLLDCVFAVIRRLRSRRSPFKADRYHCYDLLLANGWSPYQVALACSLCTAVLCVIAFIGSHVTKLPHWLMAVAGVAVLAMALCKLGVLDLESDASKSLSESRSAQHEHSAAIRPASLR